MSFFWRQKDGRATSEQHSKRFKKRDAFIQNDSGSRQLQTSIRFVKHDDFWRQTGLRSLHNERAGADVGLVMNMMRKNRPHHQKSTQ